jgi:hypothetical protein
MTNGGKQRPLSNSKKEPNFMNATSSTIMQTVSASKNAADPPSSEINNLPLIGRNSLSPLKSGASFQNKSRVQMISVSYNSTLTQLNEKAAKQCHQSNS